jgi:opacity protein-like surface antigen
MHRFVSALCLAMLSGPALSQSAESWRYELTPYLWSTAIKSELRNGPPPTVRTDMSPGDVFKGLDFGLMGALEARRGRWSLLFDGLYAKLSDTATVTNSVAGLPVSRTASANVKVGVFSGAVGYRALEGATSVDLVGGLRYNRIDVDADLSLAARGALLLAASPSFTKYWTDPYLGARVQHALGGRWSLVGYADAGGFGAGSDITWQALAGVNYSINDTFSAKLGYRHLHTDYDKDGFIYKSDLRGLYLGAGIRF